MLLQLRVGGQAARQRDETWPLDYGCVGQETTGAGGLAKALRTVPVVLDIAERARQRAAADAWIIDFTNPVGIVTRALLDAGHRAIGLCNVAIGFQRHFAELLGVPTRSRSPWTTSASTTSPGSGPPCVDGTDALPGLIAAHGDEIAAHTGLPLSVMAGSAARFPRTTCATSTRTTPWWRSSAAARPGPSRSPRSSGSCWSCTPTRRWTASRSC